MDLLNNSSIQSISNRYKIDYYLFDYWDEIGDPRNRHYPLMSGGPWPTLYIIFVYLILVTKIGPKFMKNREPFHLRKTMIIYNTFMVIMNVYFFRESLICLNYGLECFNFRYPSREDLSALTQRKLFVGYCFIISKLLDLTDTVFFVLRKKYNQVTKLHLYHHSVMPMLGWLGGLLSPTSGPCGLFLLVNSLVHAIMYLYYALAALDPTRKYLWWKKYLTLLQLIQFKIYFIYSMIFITFQSGYPASFFYVCGLPQPIVFFMLFKRFYRKTYHSMHNKLN